MSNRDPKPTGVDLLLIALGLGFFIYLAAKAMGA